MDKGVVVFPQFTIAKQIYSDNNNNNKINGWWPSRGTESVYKLLKDDKENQAVWLKNVPDPLFVNTLTMHSRHRHTLATRVTKLSFSSSIWYVQCYSQKQWPSQIKNRKHWIYRRHQKMWCTTWDWQTNWWSQDTRMFCKSSMVCRKKKFICSLYEEPKNAHTQLWRLSAHQWKYKICQQTVKVPLLCLSLNLCNNRSPCRSKILSANRAAEQQAAPGMEDILWRCPNSSITSEVCTFGKTFSILI